MQPDYTVYVTFTWDFTNGPALAFSGGGAGNNVTYWVAATGGVITAQGTAPEPGSLALVGLGLVGLAAARRKSAAVKPA